MTEGIPATAAPHVGTRPIALIRRHAAGIGVALVLAAMLVGPRWWLMATDPPRGRPRRAQSVGRRHVRLRPVALHAEHPPGVRRSAAAVVALRRRRRRHARTDGIALARRHRTARPRHRRHLLVARARYDACGDRRVRAVLRDGRRAHRFALGRDRRDADRAAGRGGHNASRRHLDAPPLVDPETRRHRRPETRLPCVGALRRTDHAVARVFRERHRRAACRRERTARLDGGSGGVPRRPDLLVLLLLDRDGARACPLGWVAALPPRLRCRTAPHRGRRSRGRVRHPRAGVGRAQRFRVLGRHEAPPRHRHARL